MLPSPTLSSLNLAWVKAQMGSGSAVKISDLYCQLVVFCFQQLVPETRDSRRLQDVVERGNVLIVGFD